MIRFEQVQSGGVSASFAFAPGTVGKVVTNSEDSKNVFVAVLLGRRCPDAGGVFLFDTDIYALGEHARIEVFRRVGAVPDDGGLISNLKVWENVLLPAAYHQGKAVADVEAQVSEIFDVLGYRADRLRRLMGRLPDELTVYEKRAAALARAMLMDPEILVYDFLLTGLGREEAAALLTLTAQFHEKRPGRLSLYVCPDGGASARIPAGQHITLEE